MARKPDYAFERRMRDKNRAAKKAARQEAKRARNAPSDGASTPADGPLAPPSTERRLDTEPTT